MEVQLKYFATFFNYEKNEGEVYDVTKYIYKQTKKLTLLAGDSSYFSLNVKFDIVFL